MEATKAAAPPKHRGGRQIIGDEPRSQRWVVYVTPREEAALCSRALHKLGGNQHPTRSEIVRALLGL